MPTPEHVVAVAEVRVLAVVAAVEERRQQHGCPWARSRRDISASPAGQEPRPLGKVRAVHQGCYEPRYLSRVSGTIRIHHGYHVPGRRLKTAGQSVTLALPGLGHHAYVRPQLTGNRHRVVHGAAIHEHYLVNILGNPLENMRIFRSSLSAGITTDTDGETTDTSSPYDLHLSETAAARSPNATGTAAHTAPPKERSGTSRFATAHSVRSQPFSRSIPITSHNDDVTKRRRPPPPTGPGAISGTSLDMRTRYRDARLPLIKVLLRARARVLAATAGDADLPHGAGAQRGQIRGPVPGRNGGLPRGFGEPGRSSASWAAESASQFRNSPAGRPAPTSISASRCARKAYMRHSSPVRTECASGQSASALAATCASR